MRYLLIAFLLVASTVAAATYVIGEQAGTVTQYHANLTDSPATLLSAIASWTPPCQLVIQVSGDYYWGIATTTAESLAYVSNLASGGYQNKWAIAPRLSNFNLGFSAATGTTASITVTVIPVVAP